MANNGGNQASPTKLTSPLLVTDEIAPVKRKRPRRCKSAPLAKPETSSFAILDSPPRSTLIKRPDPKKLAIVLSIYLGAGMLYFYRHKIDGRKTNVVIAFTSVEYGDLSPGSNLTKLLASLFAILGIFFVGQVVGKVADYFVKKQERLLEEGLHKNQTNITAEKPKEMETNRVRNMCILLVVLFVVLIAARMAVLLFVEDLDFTHAFYCVVATITSLGYTDNCFSTKCGSVFALFWILSGAIYFVQLLFTIVVVRTQRGRLERMKLILNRKTTIADSEAADLDDDGFVGKAEFILYKLKEMGKISHEDITPIMEQFERIEIDDSGALIDNR